LLGGYRDGFVGLVACVLLGGFGRLRRVLRSLEFGLDVTRGIGICRVCRNRGSRRGNGDLLGFHRRRAFANVRSASLGFAFDLVAIGVTLTITAVAATALATGTAARAIAAFGRFLFVQGVFRGVVLLQLVGFNMVLFLAGLSAIPRDLYEAAEIDGCRSGIDRFLTITWPLLGPTTMFVIVTTSITAFKVFDTVAVMTRGGPMGASEVLLYAIYLEGYQYFHMGYAAALTLIFLAFVLLFSILQTFVLDRRVHY